MAIPYLPALLIAEALFAVFFFAIPETLGTARADVIGEPAFLNFNVNRRFLLFYLQAMGVPLLTFWLTRKTPPPKWRLPKLGPLPKIHASGPFKIVSLGLIFALASVRSPFFSLFLYQVLFLAAVYTAALLAIAKIAKVSANEINSWCIPLAFFVPALVAKTATVHGAQMDYPLPVWFPIWVSAILAIGAYSWIWWHREDPEKEKKALLYFACPALIFILSAEIRYVPTLIDYTHDGEYLVSGHLFKEGLFPWRDFNLVRGLLGECFRPWVGFTLFEKSVWGARAGEALLLVPILLVFRYFLALYISRGNLFLLLVAVRLFQAPTVHIFSVQYFSMVFQPLLWICFFELLRRGTSGWAVFFAGAVFLNAAISLEGITTVVATSLILLVWRRPLFWKTLVTYVVAAAGAASYLAYHRALLPFLADFDANVIGRKYFTGYPFRWLEGWPFRLAVFLPLLCLFYVFGRLALKARQGRKLDHWDLGMAGIAVYILFSYQKFLSSPDWHIYEVTCECLPIVLWAASDFLRRPKVCFAAATLVLITYPFSLTERAQEFTRQFHRRIEMPSAVPRLGLIGTSPQQENTVRAFTRAFAGRLGPNDTVYDFSNSKGLFYYLLGLKPVGRYVYTGFKLNSQRAVIEAMRSAPPKLVIYSGGPFWEMSGIPGSVRFREVSEYLLKHYEPMVAMQGYLVLQRKPEHGVSSTDLYSLVPPCEWGFAPYVFRTPRPPTGWPGETSIDIGNPATVRYLDFEFDDLQPGKFSISDAPTPDGNEKILFKTGESGSTTLRVPVGSCPQWYQMKGGRIYLHGGQMPEKIWVGRE